MIKSRPCKNVLKQDIFRRNFVESQSSDWSILNSISVDQMIT